MSERSLKLLIFRKIEGVQKYQSMKLVKVIRFIEIQSSFKKKLFEKRSWLRKTNILKSIIFDIPSVIELSFWLVRK